MTKNGPKILEINVRFGDPECEELMPLIDSSVYDMFYYGAKGELDKIDVKIKDKVAVGVVCASKNYPYSSSEPAEIKIDKEKLELNPSVANKSLFTLLISSLLHPSNLFERGQ